MIRRSTGRVSALLIVCALSACASRMPHVSLRPPTARVASTEAATFAALDWYVMVETTISAVYVEELHRPADDVGRGFLMFQAREMGWDVDAMRTWIRASEEYAEVHKPPPPAPLHPNPLIGHLGIRGQCFADDTGCVTPRFAHFGSALSSRVRDAAKVDHQLDLVAAAGYHGVRVWMQLGCGNNQPCPAGAFWRGWEVGPRGLTADYDNQVLAFFRALTARQLRAVVSQGDPAQTGHTMAEREAYARWLAAICTEADGTGDVCAFVDAGNEAWQNDADGFYRNNTSEAAANMRRFIGAYQQAGGTGLTSTTSPPSEIASDMDQNSPSPIHVWDVHSDRGGMWWDKRRHTFSLPYESGGPKLPLGINSEPPGNGDLVSASSGKADLDHEALANIAVSAAMRQAYVWFSGEGVKLDKGLETEQGFYTVPQAIDRLPKDIATFSTLHHSGDRWRGTRVFSLPQNTQVRMDGAIGADGRFAYVVDGPSGNWTLTIERSFTGFVLDTGTGNIMQLTGVAGQPLALNWTRGRVVIGMVR